MKFELGDFEFDLGEKYTTLDILLPFAVQGVGTDLNMLLQIEELKEDDLLRMYACGDILNSEGAGLAGAGCKNAPTQKVTLTMSTNGLSDEYIALSCQQHTMILIYQMLFLLGVTLGRELGPYTESDLLDEDEEENDEE